MFNPVSALGEPSKLYHSQTDREHLNHPFPWNPHSPLYDCVSDIRFYSTPSYFLCVFLLVVIGHYLGLQEHINLGMYIHINRILTVITRNCTFAHITYYCISQSEGTFQLYLGSLRQLRVN